ncbi:MAG: phosphoribosyl-ATP diphosphatase [Peptococcaceae bacterium]|nr:phosphoribosyl-ATP diphosphatase [Peptococcaceae bacterium]
MEALNQLYAVIQARMGRTETVENSYTGYLFEQGLDKILKKVGEESAEVIIAAKNDDPRALVMELADLFYHVLVLMNQSGISMEALEEELLRRREKTGNKKPGRQAEG